MSNLGVAVVAGVVAIAGLAASPGMVQADDLTVLLGNEYAEGAYTRSADVMALDDADISLGFLMTENNNALAHGTVSMAVLQERTPLEISIGSRLFFASLVEPDDDIVGIGFGASARFRLPLDWAPFLRRFPVHVGASIYFSPEVTTSGSGVDITDLHVVRGELELAPNVDALVGLRTLDVDRDEGEEDIVDEKLYVGLRWRF